MTLTQAKITLKARSLKEKKLIWIYQNQEGDCLNDIVSGALVVVSMDAQLSWVLHPI